MATTTVLVRAKLTDNEWARIRKLAIDRRMPVSQLCGDALRALLKGAKP
jgi:hypothetical protein